MSATSDVARPAAAIDIGTNTIRLLVAVLTGDRLTPLADETVTVRLGRGVERTGQLDPERIAHAAQVIEEFRQIALSHHADPILLAATSAVRDAANGEELRRQIATTSDLDLTIVDGDREAALTFAGATLGQLLHGTVLVGDLGGGSLELIVAHNGVVAQAQSLQLGSGRLGERRLHADPPTLAMVAAVERDALAILEPFALAYPPVGRLIMVGGTATSLPRITPKPGGNLTLTLRRLNGVVAVLTSVPAGALARETGLDPERVRVLPAGAAIVGAILKSFGIDRAEVGYGGLREGLLLEYLRSRHPANH